MTRPLPDNAPEPPAAHHPLPQNIAHRGFRARCPENTLAAFRAALAAHAVALETDVHLSRDGVVVLSHDATLRRCFGRPERIADCDWAFLSTLRTTTTTTTTKGKAGEDGEPMACLKDLLALLTEPGREQVWVLLDIKRDDPPEDLLKGIADTLAATPAARATTAPWATRVVLGCWDEVYMAAARAVLPGYGLAYIGVSLAMAYALLECDGDDDDDDDDSVTKDDNNKLAPTVACFNLLQGILVGRRGQQFLQAAHARGRTVLVWTVNAAEWMDWSVRVGVDGVITDDPAAFEAVRRGYEGKDKGKDRDRSQQRGRALMHPPTARSATGLYVRRWAWLGFVVCASRAVEVVWTLVQRLRRGPERERIRRALWGV